MKARLLPAFALILAAAAGPRAAPAQERDPAIRPATGFLTPELRAQQEDDKRNPAMVWVEDGRSLWFDSPVPGAKTCADCHGAPEREMRGLAARYPRVEPKTGALLNLEGRINRCRTTRQGAPALAYDSDDLLALGALVAFLSRGVPMNVRIDGPAAPHFEAGRALFMERQGQLDLACAQCHDRLVGRKLRGDVISSGIGTGFPAYRLEWQGLGSLHRRFRACFQAVRAEPFAAGSSEFLALELYLAWRARGQPLEAPALRR